jgi:hypothetical protein
MDYVHHLDPVVDYSIEDRVAWRDKIAAKSWYEFISGSTAERKEANPVQILDIRLIIRSAASRFSAAI